MYIGYKFKNGGLHLTVKEFISTFISYRCSIRNIVIFPCGVMGIEHHQQAEYYMLAHIDKDMHYDYINESILKYKKLRELHVYDNWFKFRNHYEYDADTILNSKVFEIGCYDNFTLAILIKDIEIGFNPLYM